MTKEEIYERMTVEFVQPDPVIPCEFEDGKPCMALYGRVLDTCVSIAGRTGIDPDDDRDTREIIRCMEEIAKICALKMFDYGVRFGEMKR